MWQQNNLEKAPQGKEPFLEQFGPKLKRLMAHALPVITDIREVAERQWRKALGPVSTARARDDWQTQARGKAAGRRM